MSTELQVALGVINFLLVVLVGALYKLRDSDRRALEFKIAAASADAAKAEGKADKAQQMAVDNLERIHDQEVRAAERESKVDQIENTVALRFDQQDTQLDRIEHTLGQKVSRGEFKAVVKRDQRAELDSEPPPDPPPMRSRLPSIRGK